ncbi:MAG: NADP-dependent phosphogluconate dehydrogenase [Anaerolineaceae bacterium]|nr:NADP-dependent phosphogluconate dehydrogenase [Anaerolineaceae bacterium]
MNKANIGVVGLGVMGQNLVLNIARNGYQVAVYNRSVDKTKMFIEGIAKGKTVVPVYSIKALTENLENPKRILLMVKAGQAVDDVIQELLPFLKKGDILIDGGNSLFTDTERRNVDLTTKSIHFMGVGVSGGEEGALWGPSIMPGGQLEAWEMVKTLLQKISAKAEDGDPCVAYIGPRGAGHFVKMVHNGIEYADMQLIAECYDFCRCVLGFCAEDLAEVFYRWNKGPLKSYLIEITSRIFEKTDDLTGKPLVDLILDEASQKGTGKWTTQSAFNLGAPTNTIYAAVVSRMLSSQKSERVKTAKMYANPLFTFNGDRDAFIHTLEEGLLTAKIIAYAQGFSMMRMASVEFDYKLDLKTIASIWRAGCIIRADLLFGIMEAYDKDPELVSLLNDNAFRDIVEKGQKSLREVVIAGVNSGIPVYALSASLSYFDAYRAKNLPANLIQAQRDFFGAHTYKRIDRDGIFHTDWES